ncbi:hypothetical protein LEMA_P030720.1 [Plenodomus lingam JN3]|uniref:Protein kinase domain-containing protein n=1 Tax=Leptosphaeria maculans (strain JN3 / isolate v23.1.3 / race Av1-4-5-6-7-8) TaxID=985895 RepID=E4ZWE4_LEPMJ|nr:hypothetical protein LEMA_P030720.1 [Plenodomus lingam JN3]CBX95920.1 hypothetical protein LEMA_P030720.1 [Plenodomus lingam JN3]
MTKTSKNPNRTHVLNFFYDDEDSSALTVLVNDVRFHIIINPKDLQKSHEKPIYYECPDKVSALCKAEERGEQATEDAQSKSPNGKNVHNGGSGDSGIDVTAVEEDDTADDQDQVSVSAGVEPQNWILSALGDITEQYAPPHREPEEATLYGWYHGPAYFYNMSISSGALTPALLQTTDDLSQRIANLISKWKIPKCLQNDNIPPFQPQQPPHSGDVYVFKPVVSDKPASTKREIDILWKIQGLELDIRAPRLLGFVAHETSKTEIMGFLLSHIEAPPPLTTLLKANHVIVDAQDELWIIDFGGSYTEGWVDPELAETLEGDEMGLDEVVAALEDPERNTFESVGLGTGSEGETTLSREGLETANGNAREKRNREDDEGMDGEVKGSKRKHEGGDENTPKEE